MKKNLPQPDRVNLAKKFTSTRIILALHVLVGENPRTIRTDYPTSGAEVDSNNRIGLPEVIYILQKTSGIR